MHWSIVFVFNVCDVNKYSLNIVITLVCHVLFVSTTHSSYMVHLDNQILQGPFCQTFVETCTHISGGVTSLQPILHFKPWVLRALEHF